MTQSNLPAHLQNRQVKSLTERASEGMGGSLPPHVSIAGNTFTFIDIAGNEYTPMQTFSAAVVDISDRMNKRYYDKPYEPGSDEPPRCWSANGITPSREVPQPVAATCESCPANVRGSATSRISGAAIKACRDERWLAIVVPQLPTVIFQMTITPGSFQNWKAYTETLRGNGVELSLALTQFSFVPKETGVLKFDFVNWVDAQMADVVEAATREGRTDALVGRSDPIRNATLAAPAQAAQIAAPVAPVQEVIPPGQPIQPAFQQQAAPQAPFGTAPAAATTLQPMTAAPAAATAPAAEAPRRRRRTAAEAPAAAPAFGASPALAPQAPFGQPAQAAPTGAAQAPFGQSAAPAGQTFGIQPGAPVNPEMLAMLEQMGFQRAPQ